MHEADEPFYSSKTILHVGDHVALHLTAPDEGWLSSEGMLNDECFVSPNTDSFDDCIWEIHVQNQYSATREYREALAAMRSQKSAREFGETSNHKIGLHRPVTKEHLRQLHRAALNEQRLNEKLMSIKIGKPVAFGDPIQLRHVKSRKFLTISANVLAKDERENMRVSVIPEGNSLSCVGFLPKLRFEKEGQLLTNNSEIMVRIHEKPGEYLHASKSLVADFEGEKLKAEVNCSLESSIWSIVLYQRVADMKVLLDIKTNLLCITYGIFFSQSKVISAGQLITLQDPDSLCCITLQHHTENEDHNNVDRRLTMPINMQIDAIPPSVVMSPQYQLRDIVNEHVVGTNLLWLVEKASVSEGGPIFIASDLITLRDLNSGLYLVVDEETNSLTTSPSRKNATCFEFSIPQFSSASMTMLQEEAAVNIGANNSWIAQQQHHSQQQASAENAIVVKHTDDDASPKHGHNSKAKLSLCTLSAEKNRAASLIVSSLLYRRVGAHVHVGVQAAQNLRKLTRLSKRFQAGGLNVHSFTNIVKAANITLDSLAAFLVQEEEKSHSSRDMHEARGAVNREVMRSRQNMMREQGLLSVLLDILVLSESGIFNRIETRVARKSKRARGTVSTRSVITNVEVIDDNGSGDIELNRRVETSATLKKRGSIASITSSEDVAQPQTRRNGNSFRRNSTRNIFGGISSGDNGQDESINKAVGNFLQLQSMKGTGSNAGNSGVPDWSRARRSSNNSVSDLRAVATFEDNDDEDDEVRMGATPLTKDNQITVSHQIAQKCLKAILCLLVDNYPNQLYCADRFPILLSHVRDQRLAVLCVEEMLKENRSILQTKVREREINIFVDLLKGSEMSVTFLKLLKSTCSCPMGVDATQRMVTQALFEAAATQPNLSSSQFSRRGSQENRMLMSMKKNKSEGLKPAEQNLIIQINADRTKKLPTDWGDLTLYCPKEPERHVLGYFELQHGVPELLLSWTMKGPSNEYDMARLYGPQYSNFVPLYLVCQSMRQTRASVLMPFETVSAKISRRQANMYIKDSDTSTRSGDNSSMVTVGTYKNQVAEYFIAQLYLVADLCLDRNYVAINVLENLFEYDVLLTMLKNIQLPHSCKAAVCKVVRCLYVDREPQVATKFPRYIRTSVSLGVEQQQTSSSSNSMPLDLEADSELLHVQYKFALLQKLVAEYLTESLDLHKCDDLSIEMLQLLKALVEFGFYSTVPQILDVMKPLLASLDEHQTKKDTIATKAGKETNFTPSEENHLNKLLAQKYNSQSNSSLAMFRSSRGLNYQQVSPNFDGGREDLSGKSSEISSENVPVSAFRSFCLAFYRVTESMTWLLVVLSIVIATVVIAFIQIVSEFNLPNYVLASTLFFIIELSVRWLAYSLVHFTWWRFYFNVFNVIDLALVLLDVIIMVVGVDVNHAQANASRSLRILRAIRVVRVVRAARIIRTLANNKKESTWQLPARYSKVSKLEASTVVTILQVLNMFYDRIQDKSLDIAIKAFSVWTRGRNKLVSLKQNDKGASPIEIYKQIVAVEENIPVDLLARFDVVLLDMIMYQDEKLTHEALQLLMIHKSQRDRFLEVAENVQIICSPRIETVCRKLGNMLRELRGLAEKFEIWSELSTEEDQQSARKVFSILDSIKGYLAKRNEDRSLGIRSEILVDEEVQSLMRNLDAMSTFMALLESLFNGGREELKDSIRSILKFCNAIICWFVKNSSENQASAFRYISWFVDRVDDGIDSAKVVRAILEGNKDLIKLCPRRYLSEFAHKIMTNGRKYVYLEMFLGMTEMSQLMDSRVPAVESEISTFLTAREWKKHVLFWCCAADSEDYRSRKAAMKAYDYPGVAPPVLDDLTDDLKYHIAVVSLLSHCNLGPKLHAIYPVNDVLFALLDDATIYPVKKALAHLLVEFLRTSTDRLEKSELFWRLLERIATSWETLPSEVVQLSRSPILRIQRGEWLEITAEIVVLFFEVFDLQSYSEQRGDKPVKQGAADPRAIIHRLFGAAVRLVDDPGRIGSTLKEEMDFATLILRHHLDADEDEDENVYDMNESKLKLMRVQHQRSSVIFADVQQVLLRKDFKTFLHEIKRDLTHSKDEIVTYLERIPWVDDAESKADVRFEPLIKKICSHFRSMITRNSLSRSIEESSVEICIWFLRALRHLFENNLGVNCDELDGIDVEQVTETEKLKRLRAAYNENGVTYLCMDLIAVGIEHELCVEAMKMMVAMLLRKDGCPEIQRKVYFYLKETDSILFFELLKDLIENLKSWSIRENEAQLSNAKLRVQAPEDIMSLYLIQFLCVGNALPNREQFREQGNNSRAINLLESLASYVGILSRTESLPNIYIAIVLLRSILRLVQGPCRGNQEQFVLHTELLISLNRIIRSARPTAQTLSPLWMECLEELKSGVIDVLKGITEGQSESSLTFDRVTTTIDFSVLHLLLMSNSDFENANSPEAMAAALQSSTVADIGKGLTKAQAKYLVLAKTMGRAVDHRQYNSSLAVSGAQGIDREALQNEDICYVEVVWNQHPQIVYFHLPDFIKDISAESKDRALENVKDFASRELKLSDFVKQVKALFRESKHQQFLKLYGLSSLWTVKYYLTRFMFANAVVLNALILVHYGTEYKGIRHTAAGTTVDPHYGDTSSSYGGSSGHRFLAGSTSTSSTAHHHTSVYISTEATEIITALNIFQAFLAICTVLIYCVVQLPVNYSREIEAGLSKYTAIFVACLDPMPMWYSIYFAITIIALLVNPLFLSALLLDWVVLDTTTQDLLKAVQYPAKQLLATLGIILIMLNMFAGIMFFFYRQDVVTVPVSHMWDALKLCLSYGFRGEYGIDHEMEPTLGARMVLDVVFYFIILSILRHIFFAIIVETFAALRELKFEREMEEKNSCFICGIERHDYDRFVSPSSSSSTSGFIHHRTKAHNPMHYLYFIMSLWYQSQTEDTSLEMHVRECLAKMDVSWFPSGVSMEILAFEEQEVQRLALQLAGPGAIPTAAVISGSHGHHGGKDDESTSGDHGGGHGGGGSAIHHHGNSRGHVTTAKEHGESGDEGHKRGGRRDSTLPSGSSCEGVSTVIASSGGSGQGHHSKGHGGSEGHHGDSHHSPSLGNHSKHLNNHGSSSPGESSAAYTELLDKIQGVSRHLTKLSRQVAASSVHSSHHIGESTRNSIELPPLASPHRPVSAHLATGSSADNVPALVASSRQSDQLQILQDHLTQVLTRLDKMETKFSKSHTFLRHRMRDHLGGGVAAAAASSSSKKKVSSSKVSTPSSTKPSSQPQKDQQQKEPLQQLKKSVNQEPSPTNHSSSASSMASVGHPPSSHLDIAVQEASAADAKPQVAVRSAQQPPSASTSSLGGKAKSSTKEDRKEEIPDEDDEDEDDDGSVHDINAGHHSSSSSSASDDEDEEEDEYESSEEDESTSAPTKNSGSNNNNSDRSKLKVPPPNRFLDSPPSAIVASAKKVANQQQQPRQQPSHPRPASASPHSASAKKFSSAGAGFVLASPLSSPSSSSSHRPQSAMPKLSTSTSPPGRQQQNPSAGPPAHLINQWTSS